ncbi:DUF4347 domain-containing protein [Marinifilum sp. JC120]|nr:DUF4347 domain-containing protein [Marinifilum sp. JC120]
MRLEERIVLDGAAAVVIDHAIRTVADAHASDATTDTNSAQDSHIALEAKETVQANADATNTTGTPDVAALLNAVAPQDNLSTSTATPTKDQILSSNSKKNSQPEEDPVTVLVASSGLTDVNDLLGAAKDNVVTVTYDGDSDSPDNIFNKIESALDGKQAASIGFASHSIGSGSIHLGGDYSVDADTLLSNPEMNEFWKNVGSLVESDGHIDLLGCGVAEGEVGKDFINKLEQITGREIAASIDDTGNAESGGNWLLEDGSINLAELYFDGAKLNSFDGVLATSSVTIELASGGPSQTLYDVDGDGAYEIDSAEKLIALSQTTDKGRDWTGCSYEITADITFDADHNAVDWDGDGTVGDADDAKGFNPIGDSTNIADINDKPFVGTFYGNGHSINNLFINRDTEDLVGLFGSAQFSSIQDINLVDANVRGQNNVGAIVGQTLAFTIKNCSSTGTVRGTKSVGGLVGYHAQNSTITGSSSSCLVTGNSSGGLVGSIDTSDITKSFASGNVIGGNSVGGLLGYAFSANNTITECYATGTVKGVSNVVGGLAGLFNGTINNCYATGNVDGNENIGGLVGETREGSDASIQNSYATGTVTGTSNIGGLVGRARGTSTIDNSYATGAIDGAAAGGLVGRLADTIASSAPKITNSFASGKVTGSSGLGGLVGIIEYGGSVENSSSFGTVEGTNAIGGLVGFMSVKTSLTNCHATGTTKGNNEIGGLVGMIDGSAAENTFIKNSYATGTVNGNDRTGGLIGDLGDHVNINDSYATGTVTGNDYTGGFAGKILSSTAVDSCYAAGSVIGNDYVGGFAGLLSGTAGTEASISNSYATGTVSATSYVGGLVGRSNGKINSSYALSSQITGQSYVGRVTGQNSGSGVLNNNQANDSMSVTDNSKITVVGGNVVVGEMITDRGSAGEDGEDFSGNTYQAYRLWDENIWSFPANKNQSPTTKVAASTSAHDIYKNWGTTIWKIPADTTKNPTLKNAGTTAVNPGNDHGAGTGSSSNEGNTNSPDYNPSGHDSHKVTDVIRDPNEHDWMHEVDNAHANSKSQNEYLSGRVQNDLKKLGEFWDKNAQPYLEKASDYFETEFSELNFKKSKWSIRERYALDLYKANHKYMAPTIDSEIENAVENYVSTYSPDETAKIGDYVDAVQYAEISESVYQLDDNPTMGWEQIGFMAFDERITKSHGNNVLQSNNDEISAQENQELEYALGLEYIKLQADPLQKGDHTKYFDLHKDALIGSLQGFKMGIYKKDGHITLAFSGTDSMFDAGDVMADIAPDGFNPQLKLANAIADVVIEKYGEDITITGHSLGGFLTQKVVKNLQENGNSKVRGITFNPKSGVEGTTGINVTNYISTADGANAVTASPHPVTRTLGVTGDHIGEIKYINGGGFHGIDAISQRIKLLANDQLMENVIDDSSEIMNDFAKTKEANSYKILM